jgi:CelD/BcsL family acetyltransferase involved in cellulose biosynthesis
MITTELHRSLEAVDSLAPDWNRLFAAGAVDPSLGSGWSKAMLRNHLAGSSEWFITVVRDAGRVVAIVPWMYARARVLGCAVTTLQPVQQLSGTHGGLLLEPGHAAAVEGCIASVHKLPWDLLRISRLLESEASTDGIEAGLRAQLPCHARLDGPSYHLTLPDSYGAYLKARSGKFRNYLKRAEKKLAALGACTLESATPGHEPAAFEELLGIERASWKHAHGTAITAVPHQTGFYRDLICGADRPASMHLTFLRLDGVAVAYNLGLLVGDCYYYLKTSYREEHRPHGAASVARARLIEQLIGRNVRTLDFAGEPYEWEQQWATEVRWHRSLVAYNGTPMGRVMRLLGALRNGIARRTRRTHVAFADPRALQRPAARP